MKLDELTQEQLDTLLSEKDTMQKALDRYKDENKKFREQRDEYKTAAEGNEANKKLRDRALKAEAKLKVAGLGVKDPDRIVKYLSLDGLEFEEDGSVKGLDDAINGVKGDFPELFDPKRRVGGQVDAAADNPVRVEKSATDMQLEKLFRR